MKYEDFVKKIAKRQDLTIKTVEVALKGFAEVLLETMSTTDESISIRGLMTFKPVDKAPRKMSKNFVNKFQKNVLTETFVKPARRNMKISIPKKTQNYIEATQKRLKNGSKTAQNAENTGFFQITY
jgi:nucleoid DNA-binding protein